MGNCATLIDTSSKRAKRKGENVAMSWIDNKRAYNMVIPAQNRQSKMYTIYNRNPVGTRDCSEGV